MWNKLKSWFIDFCDCMDNAHLLDEAYMESNMDEELGRGDW